MRVHQLTFEPAQECSVPGNSLRNCSVPFRSVPGNSQAPSFVYISTRVYQGVSLLSLVWKRCSVPSHAPLHAGQLPLPFCRRLSFERSEASQCSQRLASMPVTCCTSNTLCSRQGQQHTDCKCETKQSLMPSECQGKDCKLVRPFHGPYRVLQVTLTKVEVRLVDQPKSDSIFVALERVRRCYPEQGDATWTGHKKRRRKSRKKKSTSDEEATTPLQQPGGPVTRSKSRLLKEQ